VNSEADVAEAWHKLGGAELYAEKWVPFKKELAVMVSMFVTVVYVTVAAVTAQYMAIDVQYSKNLALRVRYCSTATTVSLYSHCLEVSGTSKAHAKKHY
jgi:phosphoribosylaminoimidazole carboxylase (NCAIR synthetase)